MIENYNKFLNKIINLIHTEKFVEKQKNKWFEIIKYLEEKLRNNYQYDNYGNNLIEVISKKYIKNMNWIEIIKFLLEAFEEMKKNKLYENLSIKIIPIIADEFYTNNEEGLSIVKYLENFFLKHNYPEYKNKLFNDIIIKNYNKIGKDINAFIYFFKYAQYSSSLSKILFDNIQCKDSFKYNIDFPIFEEYIFKRLKNLFNVSYNGSKITVKENLNNVLLFLREYKIGNQKIPCIPYFIYFCSELLNCNIMLFINILKIKP